jgi:hypothetical protein
MANHSAAATARLVDWEDRVDRMVVQAGTVLTSRFPEFLAMGQAEAAAESGWPPERPEPAAAAVLARLADPVKTRVP